MSTYVVVIASDSEAILSLLGASDCVASSEQSEESPGLLRLCLATAPLLAMTFVYVEIFMKRYNSLYLI